MVQPLVSVCVPVYNGSAYLDRCLGSIAAQSYERVEIVLVDDSSTDDSMTCLEAFAGCREHVALYRNATNLGLIGNWNRCLDLAQGEWVKFVFQDDWLEPTCIETMVRHARPATDLVVCARSYEFEDGTGDRRRFCMKQLLQTSERFFGPVARDLGIDEVAAAIALWGNTNFVGEPIAVLLRRDAIYSIGPFSDRFLVRSDYVYWLRIAMHSGLTWVPDQLAGFLVHDASVSGNNLESFAVQQLESASFFGSLMHDEDFAPFREHLRRSGELDRYRSAVRWHASECYHQARWLHKSGQGDAAIAAWETLAVGPSNAAVLEAPRVRRMATVHRLRRKWLRRSGTVKQHLRTLFPVDLEC